MNYHRETSQVQYRSKDGKETKVFDALEWPRQKAAGKALGSGHSNLLKNKPKTPENTR
jgi:hypothetical protein